MNGTEAKYTAKHLAKLIKHNRKVAQRAFKFYAANARNENMDMESYDKYAIAKFVSKQTRIMSQEFRAYMIHNAFKKGREFTTAEVKLHNLGENAVTAMKADNEQYSLYMDKLHKQQTAIKIVRNTLLEKDEQVKFDEWLAKTTA